MVNMNILVLGSTGFIGTNLIFKLAEDKNNSITAFDRTNSSFDIIKEKCGDSVKTVRGEFSDYDDFETLTKDIDIVYHLVSTTNPSLSNRDMKKEMADNVGCTISLLDACVKNKVKKLVFISSGGTVYGKNFGEKFKEEDITNPMCSYGIQKLTIEKFLYLYNYLYGLDYRVVRLANPYGPHQRPNSGLGVITTFAYKALTNEQIQIFGDGSVVRDFIYIDDAIQGILKIASVDTEEKVFNLGYGEGHSVLNVVDAIEKILDKKLDVKFVEGRKADVPYSVLDTSRFERICGGQKNLTLEQGIEKLIDFLKKEYSI